MTRKHPKRQKIADWCDIFMDEEKNKNCDELEVAFIFGLFHDAVQRIARETETRAPTMTRRASLSLNISFIIRQAKAAVSTIPLNTILFGK